MSIMKEYLIHKATILRPSGSVDIYGNTATYTKITANCLEYRQQKVVYTGTNQTFTSFMQFIVDVEVFQNDLIVLGTFTGIIPDKTFKNISYIQPIDNFGYVDEWECFI